MSEKRPGDFSMADRQARKAKLEKSVAANTPSSAPVHRPTDTSVASGLTRGRPARLFKQGPERGAALRTSPPNSEAKRSPPHPFAKSRPGCWACLLAKVPHLFDGARAPRHCDGSQKPCVRDTACHAFDCSPHQCSMLSGVSRSQFVKKMTCSGMN